MPAVGVIRYEESRMESETFLQSISKIIPCDLDKKTSYGCFWVASSEPRGVAMNVLGRHYGVRRMNAAAKEAILPHLRGDSTPPASRY
jgi:hypothetical protein